MKTLQIVFMSMIHTIALPIRLITNAIVPTLKYPWKQMKKDPENFGAILGATFWALGLIFVLTLAAMHIAPLVS